MERPTEEDSASTLVFCSTSAATLLELDLLGLQLQELQQLLLFPVVDPDSVVPDPLVDPVADPVDTTPPPDDCSVVDAMKTINLFL